LPFEDNLSLHPNWRCLEEDCVSDQNSVSRPNWVVWDRRTCNENKLPLGERLEDLEKANVPNRKYLILGREIKRAILEAAARIIRINELFVFPRSLLRCRGEVVEMRVGEGLGPVCVDGGHV
jgi:hypothetical protein